MTGIVWWDGQRMSTLPADIAANDLLVLYEDNHLLAVFKPPGLLSQGPGEGDTTILDVARAWIRRRTAKPGGIFLGVVHRLDRPVGGVMILTKTSKAASRLSEQFRSGMVHKTYQAVVEGLVPERGVLASRMVRGSRHRVSRIVSSEDGKAVSLTFRRLDVGATASLVEIHPHTGRTHQIRVQLASAGHPIVGDKKYGSRYRLPGRIALLAKEISFVHPVRGAQMNVSAPTPVDWPWPLPQSVTTHERSR